MRCLVIYRSKLKGHSAVIAHAVRVRLGSWERVGSSPTFGTNIGVSPSGKAQDFDSCIRWFEPIHPSHFLKGATRDGLIAE